MLFKPPPVLSVIGSSFPRGQPEACKKTILWESCAESVVQVQMQAIGLRKLQLVPPLALLRRRRLTPLHPLLSLPPPALGVLKLLSAGTSECVAMPGLDCLPAVASPATSRSRSAVGHKSGGAQRDHGTAGSSVQPTDAEDVSHIGQSRSQPSRAGSLVSSGLVARSEQRVREAERNCAPLRA